MFFVTFQPQNWHDVPPRGDYYRRYIGFNPIYAICAESLALAVVGSLLASPNMPEVAVFFKCKDFYTVNSIWHALLLQGNYDYLSLKSREDWKKDGKLKDLTALNIATEFLVRKEDMQIIKEIDIKESLIGYDYDLVSETKQHDIQEWIDQWIKIYQEDPKKDTWDNKEAFVHSCRARYFYEDYVCYTNCFINDYKQVIGCKNADVNVDMEVDEHIRDKLFDYIDDFVYLTDEHEGCIAYVDFIVYFSENFVAS